MTVETLSIAARRGVAAVRAERGVALEQLVVVAGQIVAGVGNLAFSLVMVRLLAPGAFAAFASIGALYLVLNMPIASLTAGSALDPTLEARLRHRLLVGGGAFALVLAIAAVPVARGLNLSVPLVLLLALAVPGAAPLAFARGRLYRTGRRRGLVASLVAEPLGRLVLGSWLAPLVGATGAGLAVVAGGYVSLAVARIAARRELPTRRIELPPRRGGTVAAFLLLAVLQNQDLVLGNAVLGREQAAVFAVLSTLGGIAAFATATVPLVLLPHARSSRRAPLWIALAVAGALGACAVVVGAVAPGRLVETLFGARYHAVAGLVVPYLVAMALLGVARVLVAQRCGEGRGRTVVALLAGGSLLQLVVILALARTASGVAYTTLAATALVAGGAAAGTAYDLRAAAEWALARVRQPHVAVVLGLAGLGLTLRLLITRGLWIDEATSVTQAQMSFGGMLHNLRAGDVHPPLYFSLLWLDVRVFGTGELAVRFPSVLAGTLLVPALYVCGRDLYDRRAGLIAAAFGAVAPQAVWYSQEARMYTLFMLFAVLALWGQVRAVRRGRPVDWAIYTAATAALFWTQYFSVLLIAVQQLAFVVAFWRRRSVRPVSAWLLSGAVLIVLVLPLVPFAQHQFLVNQASGRGFGGVPSQTGGAIARQTHPSLYAFLANGVWAVWGYHSDRTMVDLVALWPLVMLFALALLGRGLSGTTALLVAAAALPPLFLFALGQQKSDLFDLRYFIEVVPAVILLAARGLTTWARRAGARMLVTALLGLSLLLGLMDQQLNGSNPRLYDFRGALHAIEVRARPGDVLLYNPQYLGDVVRYYAPHMRAHAAAGAVPRGRKRRVFVLGSFFDHPQIAAATRATVARLGRTRKLILRLHDSNVRVWGFR
jgi:O-antigen/teichoic acid export membrane protein